MFFSVSKLLVHFERPGDLLLLLLLAGLVMAWTVRFRRTGLVLASAAAFAFLAIAVLPVAIWVAAPLETRFPRTPLPRHVDGLIILGGAVDALTTLRHGTPALNAEAERMTEFVRLAKLYPGARLVFSGGAATFTVDPKYAETGVARLFFQQQGLDTRRIVFEGRSRDTYENVLFSKVLMKPRRGEVWLLVTSAQDMPRCIGIFRKQGWPVIPVPVAYKADITGRQNLAANLHLLDNATHEWLGLLAYRLAGRTDALFPSPEKP